MESPDSASDPPIDALRSVFHLRETRRDGDRVLFYGESLVPEQMLIREVWTAFREAGYEVQVSTAGAGRTDVVVARPVTDGIDGIPWKNVGLFLATVVSTLLVGALTWYYIPLSEIRANPLDADFVPLSFISCLKAVWGIQKAHPKSQGWVRGTFYQGAPLPEDLRNGTDDYWLYPSKPQQTEQWREQ